VLGLNGLRFTIYRLTLSVPTSCRERKQSCQNGTSLKYHTKMEPKRARKIHFGNVLLKEA
jgi:hypothetical protein